MKKIAEFTIRYKWFIVVFFLLISGFLATQMKKATFNADMLTYMPEDMPTRIQKRKIEEIFGGTEMIMVIVETDDIINPKTLKRVKKISHSLTRLKGVDNVMSVFETKQVRSEYGAMIVDPAVRKIPRSLQEISEIKQEIKSNELVYGSVISKDFTTTAVIAILEAGLSDEYIVNEAQKIIESAKGNEKVYLGGSPFTRIHIANNTMKDIVRLLPLGLLLMLIFLFICFRQFRGVWIPFVIVLMSIFVSMGLMPLLGWQITAITIILPVLLIAVANDYGIHMIAKYQEDNVLGNKLSKKELIYSMLSSLGTPIILAGITTIVGLVCLLGHILIPAGQIGILAAIGIAVALIASLVVITAISAILPKAKPLQHKNTTSKEKKSLNKFLTKIGYIVSEHSRKLLIYSLIFTIVCALGLFRVVVDTNPIEYFSKEHPVVTSTETLNKSLGGFFPLSIVFKGDIKEPGLLRKIDNIEKQLDKMPDVGATTSIAKVIRQISRAINEPGDSLYNCIPDSYNAVAQYLELYMMSGDPEDLEKMVDFNFEHAMILLRFNKTSTPILRKNIKKIKAIIGDDSSVEYIGGNSAVFSELDLCVVNGQLLSFSIAIGAIFILLWVVFRSARGAALAVMPLVLSLVFLFGIMGYMGVDLNMVTALLSTIMIGVGIDYTIHYLWRYKSERKKGLSPQQATIKTLETTGRGIIFNAFSVIIGFSALIFSTFMPVKFFGLLVVLTIATCLMSALVIIPSLCIWLRPGFLEPKMQKMDIDHELESGEEKTVELLEEITN